MVPAALSSVSSALRAQLLQYFPRTPLGYSFLFLLLWNAYGLPLVWHARAIGPYFWFLLTGRLAISLGLRPKPLLREQIGKDPLERSWTKEFRAWPSETDMFGFHLS